MATTITITQKETTMPFVTINTSNAYDPSNNARYATQAEADARAREVLNLYPTAKVYVAQVLKEYAAIVTITATDPEAPETSGE